MRTLSSFNSKVYTIKSSLTMSVISEYVQLLLSESLYHTNFRRDHRDTWNFTNTEPVSGNYYPVNSRIYLRVSCFISLSTICVLNIFHLSFSLILSKLYSMVDPGSRVLLENLVIFVQNLSKL